jgi:protein-disulfide isomerase
MLSSRILVALGLGVALTVVPKPVAAQDGSTVIAEVGDHKITADDLQQKAAGKLLQARYKYYLAERDALEQLIDQQLLEMQAAHEGISVDELLKRHVESEVKPPTEDQMRFYYEGLQTEESYEVLRAKILDSVHEARFNKARTAYVANLRAESKVVVQLAQPSAQVDVTGSPRRGPENAAVQLVEFADYECPYCQKVHPDLVKLQQQFGSNVALVYKDFPLPMHPLAEKAAEAARCARVQGKFWEYHDALFENKRLQVSDLKQQAVALKLDSAQFNQCLDSGQQAAAVKKDAAEGLRLGLAGTPSFFTNGHFLSGALGYPKLREAVLQELSPMGAAKSVASTGLKENLPK